MEKVTHVFIVKEKTVGDMADFGISYKAINQEDLKPLSNNLFMASNALNFMNKFDISFDEAVKLHFEWLEQQKQKGDN